jgi:hypothetical protein
MAQTFQAFMGVRELVDFYPAVVSCLKIALCHFHLGVGGIREIDGEDEVRDGNLYPQNRTIVLNDTSDACPILATKFSFIDCLDASVSIPFELPCSASIIRAINLSPTSLRGYT